MSCNVDVQHFFFQSQKLFVGIFFEIRHIVGGVVDVVFQKTEQTHLPVGLHFLVVHA